MRKLPYLLLLSCFPLFVSAQEIVDVEEQDPSLAFLLNIVLPVRVDHDVRNFKIVYTTTDAFGQLDTVSGLLSVPSAPDMVFPMAVYNHGTVAERDGVPSVEGVAERLLVAAFAGSGYITVAPDYLGLGVSDGIHPYVHAETEARVGRDMIQAVRSWLETEEDIQRNEQLFLTGYSQGGHATQALHRDLEMNPGDNPLIVTAASHLSGPYSISEVMLGTLFEEDLATLPGYIVYTYVSYNYVYGIYDSLNQIFVEPYFSVVDSFDQGQISLGQFNSSLDTLLRQNDAMLGAIFQDSILQVLRERDPNEPIIQALIDNDTYDWAPEAPTLIYYCTEDEQVPFRNAIIADSVMRANGSTNVTLESGGALTHGGCVSPASIRTLRFFDQYANVYPVSLGEPAGRPEIGLVPNPVSAGQPLRLTGLPAQPHAYVLYDQSGRRLLRGKTDADGSLHLPAGLPRGLSVLRVGLADGTSVVRKVLLR